MEQAERRESEQVAWRELEQEEWRELEQVERRESSLKEGWREFAEEGVGGAEHDVQHASRQGWCQSRLERWWRQ